MFSLLRLNNRWALKGISWPTTSCAHAKSIYFWSCSVLNKHVSRNKAVRSRKSVRYRQWKLRKWNMCRLYSSACRQQLSNTVSQSISLEADIRLLVQKMSRYLNPANVHYHASGHRQLKSALNSFIPGTSHTLLLLHASWYHPSIYSWKSQKCFIPFSFYDWNFMNLFFHIVLPTHLVHIMLFYLITSIF